MQSKKRVVIKKRQCGKCETMRLHARPAEIGYSVSRSLTVNHGRAGTSPLVERIETFSLSAWTYVGYG